MPESEKRCYRCGRDRPLADFIAKRNGEVYDMCSPCLTNILTEGGSRGKKERLAHTPTHRVCYLCRQTKPSEAFTRRSDGSYFSACKACNVNVFAHRRRARLLAAEGSFTTQEWLELLARHPTCPGCGRRWEDIPLPRHMQSVVTRDHVIAVSKGGSNGIENIQPLCYSCNSRKGDR
jgi:5-methylcytosine-specific restriction endonuclease McrA